MTYWRDPEPTEWATYAAKLSQLWHKPKWSKSIFVDGHPPAGVTGARPLHSHLQQLSSNACRVCDRQAHRPFASTAGLAKHVREQHKQHLCHVCLEVTLSSCSRIALQPRLPCLQLNMSCSSKSVTLCSSICLALACLSHNTWAPCHFCVLSVILCLPESISQAHAGTLPCPYGDTSSQAVTAPHAACGQALEGQNLCIKSGVRTA